MREIELRLTWIENQENLLDGVAIISILWVGEHLLSMRVVWR